jgi:hypothetical protein
MASLRGKANPPRIPNALLNRLASLAIGFLLSLLGSIVLFLGQIGVFASEYIFSAHLEILELKPFAALFVIGTIVSLIGTGFLLGVRAIIQRMFFPC